MRKNSVLVLSSALLVLSFWFTGCEKNGWEQQERMQIERYIKSLGDTIYDLKSSGLYYIELVPGTGASPVNGDTVTFWSRGCLLDYQEFTSNYAEAEPFKYVVGSGKVLKGIDEGIKYMKEGGIARLILPSKLAFGNYGVGLTIPGYTPLLYDVRLVTVRPGPK
jgi:FKBP-type peptidyl-prolyl cis-trans isomerase